jgi:hypothetical protein
MHRAFPASFSPEPLPSIENESWDARDLNAVRCVRGVAKIRPRAIFTDFELVPKKRRGRGIRSVVGQAK